MGFSTNITILLIILSVYISITSAQDDHSGYDYNAESMRPADSNNYGDYNGAPSDYSAYSDDTSPGDYDGGKAPTVQNENYDGEPDGISDYEGSSPNLQGQSTSNCEQPRDGVDKTGIKSKYFHARGEEMSYSDMQQFCEQRGLQMAEINSEADINHLETFAKSISPWYHTFMLATTAKDGMFSNPSGPIAFQNFEPGFQFVQDLPCVVVRFEEKPIMYQISCEVATGVLCQFSSNDPCFANSVQEESKFVNELIPSVGGLEGSHFLIGSTQKSKPEAETFCESQRAKLLDIPNQKVNEHVWRIAREYASSIRIDPRTSFWTAGSTGPNGRVTWPSLNGDAMQAGNVIYNWGEGSEPGSDTSVSCVTVGAEFPSKMEGIYVTTLRMKNCDMPHYFICYHGELPNDDVAPFKVTNETESTVPLTMTPLITMSTPVPYEPPTFEDTKVDKPAKGRIEPEAEEKIEEEKETKSCYSINVLPPFELNYEKQMEFDEIVALAKWTRDNHIEESGIDFPYKAESEWRKGLITVLANIFKNVCSTDDYLIPLEYINAMTIVISLYYNSLHSNFTQTKVGNQVWDEMMIPLNLCVNSSTPLSLKAKGMYVDEWRMRESGQSQTILIPEEYADEAFWKNPVIEVFWNMFSLSVGYCMPRAVTPINWATEYFHNFNMDYLEPVKEVWISKKSYDFGVLIGDFDLNTLAYNIRACTVAAYMENGLADRQLTRPLKMNKDHALNSMNEKTGKAVITVT